MQSMIKRAIDYLLSLEISSANILDPELLQLLIVAVMSVDNSQGRTATITPAALIIREVSLQTKTFAPPRAITLEQLTSRIGSKWEVWRASEGHHNSLLQTPLQSTPMTRQYSAWIHGLWGVADMARVGHGPSRMVCA